MKKVLVLFSCSLLLSLATVGQTRSFLHLVGMWEAIGSEDRSGGLEIVDSAKIFLVYGDERRAVVSYKADFSKTPGWFDFTIKDSTGSITLKSLIQFINDDLLQWQVFEEDVRPAHFTQGGGQMVYLRRKK